MNDIRTVEDMPVYQRFYQLALSIAACTKDFPRDFGWLRIHMLKSSEPVSANMTEGFYSQYSTEYLQCLYRCRRESRETMTHITYARDLSLMGTKTALHLLGEYEATLLELSRLIASIERKVRSHGKAKPGAVREEQSRYDYTATPINH